VQALEEDLRIKLLHRSTRSVRLTAEGAAYYERVVALLSDLTDIEASARQALASPEGRIRVEVAAALGTTVVLPALSEFYRDYPRVQVELGIGNRVVDIVADGIDCAVRIGEVTEQGLVARRVGEFKLCTCAAPSVLEAHGVPEVPQDLARWPTIGLGAGHGFRALPFRFANAQQVTDQELDHRLIVNDTVACVAAGVVGLGVMQAPTYAVQPWLASGKLVRVLDEWCTPGVPVSIVYAPNRYLSTKVRVFIDWTVGLFERLELLRRDTNGCEPMPHT